MTIATRILQRYIARAVRTEYDAWRRSGRPAVDYLQVRAPFVADALSPTGAVGSLLADVKDRPDRQPRADRSTDPAEAARALRIAADEATSLVERLESETAEPVDTDEVLEDLRVEVEQKVADLTEKARIEANGRVALARQRLAEIEDQAALHVDEVQRRAQATANTISADALARIANTDADRQAEIDRARSDARAAVKRAERAEQRAQRSNSNPHATVETDDDATTFSSLREMIVRAGRRAVDADSPQPTRSARHQTSELESLDHAALYAVARHEGIPGRSQMTDAQLIDALSESSVTA